MPASDATRHYARMKMAIERGIRLLDTHQVAAITGMSEVTIRRWRVQGGGPPFVRLGRSVRYHPIHVERWALDNLCIHPSARSGREKTHVAL